MDASHGTAYQNGGAILIDFVQYCLESEAWRQACSIELIASENFVSKGVQEAVGSCLTNKYAEGYPAKRESGNAGRYYGGCDIMDTLEEYCCTLWKDVFHTHYHVNVQPHSGSNANLAAYLSVLKPGDTILSMSLDNGGHLTHGSKANISGKLYNIVSYGLTPEGLIDYADLEKKIVTHLPHLVVAGASAYSRIIDFKRIRGIINRCIPAYERAQVMYRPKFMVDMSHIAGLIAAEVHPTPFGVADIVTTTTHKTLRGPRGGLIFCKQELAKKIDSAVFPGVQGGPLMHVIAGKAVAAQEALTPEYKTYIEQVVLNCVAMSNEFVSMGYKVVTGGTDNHMFLLDLTDTGVTGKELQEYLDGTYGITLNKNMIPGDRRKPKDTSGVRIGTAAMTTKGYKEQDFIRVAHRIDEAIKELMEDRG